MGLVHFLGVRCNLCRSLLKISEVADGWDKGKILPGLPSTTAAVIIGGMAEATEIALGAGWQQSPDDERAGRIDPRWACRACTHRIRSMHAWISTNRMTDHVDE